MSSPERRQLGKSPTKKLIFSLLKRLSQIFGRNRREPTPQGPPIAGVCHLRIVKGLCGQRFSHVDERQRFHTQTVGQGDQKEFELRRAFGNLAGKHVPFVFFVRSVRQQMWMAASRRELRHVPKV